MKISFVWHSAIFLSLYISLHQKHSPHAFRPINNADDYFDLELKIEIFALINCWIWISISVLIIDIYIHRQYCFACFFYLPFLVYYFSLVFCVHIMANLFLFVRFSFPFAISLSLLGNIFQLWHKERCD